MVFRTSGPAGSDALNLAMNGTVYFSNFTGEMRWYYEGRTPVLMSRDALGFTRRDYVNFVQGQSSVCGTQIDPNRRVLVFSRLPAGAQGWLSDCWYL